MWGLIPEGIPESFPKPMGLGDPEGSAGVSWVPEILGVPQELLSCCCCHRAIAITSCVPSELCHPVCPL